MESSERVQMEENRHAYADATTSAGGRVRASGTDVNKDGSARELQKPVAIKTPKYAVKGDWEAFHGQFELLAWASARSDERKPSNLLCV